MNAWISVKERFPPEDEFVWLLEGDRVWIGGLVCDGDGSMWGNAYGSQYWHKGGWQGDLETDDDYQPTHWMPLPVPLAQEKASEEEQPPQEPAATTCAALLREAFDFIGYIPCDSYYATERRELLTKLVRYLREHPNEG